MDNLLLKQISLKLLILKKKFQTIINLEFVTNGYRIRFKH